MIGSAFRIIDDQVGVPSLRRHLKLVVPDHRDPRIRLAAVIMGLQILGQTLFGFKLSVAQILVSIGICAAIEIVATYHRERAFVWPASAILTGNSIAFILRASGTRHGDWWSLNGIEYFVLAALIALLAKYLIRAAGRNLYNPSNIGLVLCLLVVGAPNVFPQYLWWGPTDVPVIAATAVILLGGFWVLRRLDMGLMVLSFLLAFFVLVGGIAGSGGCFSAVWHPGPVCGVAYWTDICTSPELLIFVLFMMSDPKTAPRSSGGRVFYGALTALVAGGLIAYQPTEFGIKVAILASLTVTCSLSPLLEWLGARLRGAPDGALAGSHWERFAEALVNPAIVAAAVVATAVPIAVMALATNQQVLGMDGMPTSASTRAPQ